MKAGPKAQVDPSPVPFTSELVGAARFAQFCLELIVVPKGTGARGPLVLRDWQVDLVASILDADPVPRLAGWMLPRGQGKSTLVAALGLYELLLGPEGASVVVVATDERQAGIVFRAAARMVELNPELESRVQAFQAELRVPERGASFQVLPAQPKRLEGLDPSLAILDEIGVISRDTYEVVALASGKRDQSTLLGIGTPGPDPHDSVLLDMRNYGTEHPEDTSFVWREHSAAGFEEHPVDCEHCWTLANPAMSGDLPFLHVDAMRALLPPKTREATFRRARLCQFTADRQDALFPRGAWDAIDTGKPVPDGTDVVVAFDGSFNSDSTAILVASVSKTPHVDVVALWEAPEGDETWRVPVIDVEAALRATGERWNVLELIADPFRWTRSLQILEADGLPVVEFPHSPSRLTAATADLYRAVIDGDLSHSGDRRLGRHVANAVVIEDTRGARISKERRQSTRHIDLAACLVMAHSRATWRANKKTPKRKMRSFK